MLAERSARETSTKPPKLALRGQFVPVVQGRSKRGITALPQGEKSGRQYFAGAARASSAVVAIASMSVGLAVVAPGASTG